MYDSHDCERWCQDSFGRREAEPSLSRRLTGIGTLEKDMVVDMEVVEWLEGAEAIQPRHAATLCPNRTPLTPTTSHIVC